MKKNSNVGNFALSANITHCKNIVLVILIVLQQEWVGRQVNATTEVQNTAKTLHMCTLVYLFWNMRRIFSPANKEKKIPKKDNSL